MPRSLHTNDSLPGFVRDPDWDPIEPIEKS
jgi:hypothetical protein